MEISKDKCQTPTKPRGQKSELALRMVARLTLQVNSKTSAEKKVKKVSKSCPTLAIPRTVACQAPLSIVVSRQEYWSGLPFPSLLVLEVGDKDLDSHKQLDCESLIPTLRNCLIT